MIQFHLSKDAAKDLAVHVQQKQPINSQALQWYVHRVTIARRKCLIAMELQSRYAIVFCGLTKKEFDSFPAIFAERFWREAMLVLETHYRLDDKARDELGYWCQEISSASYYQEGSDRSVGAHMKDVIMFLRIKVEVQGYPLPTELSDAVYFGLRANETPRRSKDRQDWFSPIREYREFWAGLLERVCGIRLAPLEGTKNIPNKTPQDAGNKPGTNPINNVVQVDFSKGRRT